MKSGFISIIGRPNVGKSTLLNAVLGEKIAIATNKPQTTRNTIRGIYTTDDAQMVFLDTPGIHKGKTKLGEYMTDLAFTSLKEVEVILFLVDSSITKGPGDAHIVEFLKKVNTPKFLIINKMDTMSPDEYRKIYEEYEEIGIFEEIIGLSALESTNIDILLDKIEEKLEEGPQYFPREMLTDNPERFLVSEILREKALLYLDDEVPHGVAVEIEAFVEEENVTKIAAVIYCERKSHKGIIIGKGGRKLKGIGKSSREEIEALLGCKVFLQLWVKVKENWRDSNAALSNFGYRQ
ncbi:MAG: GTPase Era [Eubacteriales bacterium]|nr:GTPase Era [Eubacteriales bacterium]MDY3332976.1 GTPase Era [Gallibacter sp.]